MMPDCAFVHYAVEAEQVRSEAGRRGLPRRRAAALKGDLCQRPSALDGKRRRGRRRCSCITRRSMADRARPVLRAAERWSTSRRWSRGTRSEPGSHLRAPPVGGDGQAPFRASPSTCAMVRCQRSGRPIYQVGFDDLRHVSLTLVRVVARVRVGRIADGIARHIRLDLESRRALRHDRHTHHQRSRTDRAEPSPGSQNCRKLCRRRETELQHQG